ncbi:LysR family transcriptional regulator [Phenylobacterium deserti]|uniref:LysR family transcriptional regulator n=1 Tax=Phenylobacterium deserti TaxID=1914756 RepID=A0A328AI44_9CAUL|nr:LysR family transcriptional regulator [Phenylobacterium deserti]RAK52518.1 LysR family transcriptional regulator [Phenylobacterium deserti]
MDDWNDLKLVLAISRSGSLTSAARDLAVAHSTAFRRLNALEGRLGVRLFERLPAGAYAPTTAGERMTAAAERVESEAAALDRDLLGADTRLSGTLKVTSSETLGYKILTPLIAEFREKHPGIDVTLVVDNRVLSLSRREADVALRVARPKEPDLHGRKVAEIGWCVYGARRLLEGAGRIEAADLPRQRFIGWEEGVGGINTADWLNRTLPEGAFAYRTNSVINQMIAARAGVGLALLPCYLGDGEPLLARVLPEPLRDIDRELWMVTHADLRRTARVRAFMDVIGQGIGARRVEIAGRAD